MKPCPMCGYTEPVMESILREEDIKRLENERDWLAAMCEYNNICPPVKAKSISCEKYPCYKCWLDSAKDVISRRENNNN